MSMYHQGRHTSSTFNGLCVLPHLTASPCKLKSNCDDIIDDVYDDISCDVGEQDGDDELEMSEVVTWENAEVS